MTHASVVGITFCEIKNRMDIWTNIKAGVELMMEREPTNPRDRNAVKVSYGTIHVGYIEREVAGGLSTRMKEQDISHLTCKVLGINGTPLDRPVLVVEF